MIDDGACFIQEAWYQPNNDNTCLWFSKFVDNRKQIWDTPAIFNPSIGR
jgi:hypothetical protein